MAKVRRTFSDANGTTWRVSVANPGASNAQVLFGHPDPRRTRENRYAHFLVHGPEASDVSRRVDPKAILSALDDAAIAGLFKRSMSMSGRPTIEGVNV